MSSLAASSFEIEELWTQLLDIKDIASEFLNSSVWTFPLLVVAYYVLRWDYSPIYVHLFEKRWVDYFARLPILVNRVIISFNDLDVRCKTGVRKLFCIDKCQSKYKHQLHKYSLHQNFSEVLPHRARFKIVRYCNYNWLRPDKDNNVQFHDAYRKHDLTPIRRS